MYVRRVPVIVVDSSGNRRLSGQALVESQNLDEHRDVKITLIINAESLINLTDLKMEFISQGSVMGSREEIVITKIPVDSEPEFRIKGL